MNKMISNFSLIATATVTALITGLFYSYSCSVNVGLGKLSDEIYLTAMQSINKEILNPLFFISFMGTLILLPVSTWLHYQHPLSSRFIFLLLATGFYLVGTFCITLFCNVPLNDALAQFDIKAATAGEIAIQRMKFEQPWNKWHSIRTVASVVTLILVLMACLKDKVVQD